MLQLNPQSQFPVVRQLADSSDTGTYYVQAVCTNSLTGTVLQTINLTGGSGQRFTGTFNVPPDGSGNGLYIDITTTVYSDSGYTTKSEVYGSESNTYVVQQRYNHVFGGGGGEISYDKIRAIIKDEIARRERTEIPESRDVTPELLGVERRLKASIDEVVGRIPAPERPDLEGAVMQLQNVLEQAANAILMSIETKPVTPQTDVQPIVDAIQSLPLAQMEQYMAQLKSYADTIRDFEGMRAAADEFMAKIPQRQEFAAPTSEEKRLMFQDRARKLMGV